MHWRKTVSYRRRWRKFPVTAYRLRVWQYFVVLTAALSGCNSGMYSCGRMLYALAKNRQLPAAMAKVSRHGVPVAGVAVSIAILLIGSCLNYIIPNPQRVFVYVYSASVLPGMVPWFVILIGESFPSRRTSCGCGSIYCYSANWLMPELHHSQSAACVCLRLQCQRASGDGAMVCDIDKPAAFSACT